MHVQHSQALQVSRNYLPQEYSTRQINAILFFDTQILCDMKVILIAVPSNISTSITFKIDTIQTKFSGN